MQSQTELPVKNPRRVAAGMINGRLRRPWTEQDRQHFRRECFEHQPWLNSTGPRTEEGKYRASRNGWLNGPEPDSTRSTRKEAVGVGELIAAMSQMREALKR
jgi:hypothetical protein